MSVEMRDNRKRGQRKKVHAFDTSNQVLVDIMTHNNAPPMRCSTLSMFRIIYCIILEMVLCAASLYTGIH